jgi:hypothetical protein
MFARLLGVIQEALDARVIGAGTDGEPVDLTGSLRATYGHGGVHQAVDAGAARAEGDRADGTLAGAASIER